MTLHFHPHHRTPGFWDYALCAMSVAIVSFFAGLMLRAAFNSIF